MNKCSTYTHWSASKQAGYTLVEVMVVVTIIALLALVAVPSIGSSVAKGRTKAAAEDIFGLVSQAKVEGPIRDLNLSVNSYPDATPWCVGYSATANCDCRNTTSCVIPVAGTNVTQLISGAEYPGVTISESFPSGTSFNFNRIRGSASQAGSIQVVSGDWQLRINVTADGLVRLCNPTNNAFLGYEAC